ncbi:hypothetical protein [Methylobacterium sp. Leaf87]|uniref:hypothetical protein n=1 Tax=Methylobacterium sp. Leaf87 TaxID=1736243 RepID=UPI000A7AA300|nr:hypothetical protein [Methylobacterium sp. Leaf87]
MLFPLAATAMDDRGYATAITKFWFTGDEKLGCVDSSGNSTLCKIAPDTIFQVYYSPDLKHALVVVDYLSGSPGNARLRSAVTTEEASETGGWGVTHQIYKVIGQGPISIKFDTNNVYFEMQVRKSNDLQCCPTGRRLYTMPL